MAMPVGQASSLAEEISDDKIEHNEVPFVNIGTFLEKNHIHVPHILFHEASKGLLLLEDFGDQTLLETLKSASQEIQKTWYEKCLDQMLRMQSISPDRSCLAFGRSYNEFLYTWEFDHFLEFGLHKQDQENSHLIDSLKAEFAKLTNQFMQWKKVLCHRDFHSRNLMILPSKEIGVIDFQDALMGSLHYDIASLLADAYIELERNLVEDLFEGLFLEYKKTDSNLSLEEFIYRSDVMSIQRNLKAFGRFFYIDQVKGNNSYLKDTPRLARYIRNNVERHSSLRELGHLLLPAVEKILA